MFLDGNCCQVTLSYSLLKEKITYTARTQTQIFLIMSWKFYTLCYQARVPAGKVIISICSTLSSNAAWVYIDFEVWHIVIKVSNIRLHYFYINREPFLKQKFFPKNVCVFLNENWDQYVFKLTKISFNYLPHIFIC